MKHKWIVMVAVGLMALAGTARANGGEHGDDDGHGHGHDKPGHEKPGHGHDKPHPGNPVGQCVKDARAERKTCDQVCKDTFLSAVDTCKGADRDCLEQAGDDRRACVTEVLTALRQCVEDSCGDLRAEIAACRMNFPPGPETTTCIDDARLLHFQCRASCRDSVELFTNLKACRDEFRADVRLCRNPPVPMPTNPMGP